MKTAKKITRTRFTCKSDKYLRQTIDLAPFDIMVGNICMRTAMAFDYPIPEYTLLAGLQKTIEEIPFLTGRFKQNKTHYFIDCDNAGLDLEIQHIDQAMPPYGYERQMKQDISRYVVHLSMFANNKDKAIVGIKITYFTDGMIIGFSNLHPLLDGHAAWQVITRWAENCFNPHQVPLTLKQLDRTQLYSPASKMIGIVNGNAPSHACDFSQFSRWQKMCFYLSYMLSTFTLEHIIYHLPSSALADEKQKIINLLANTDKWVSTQDAAMARVLQTVAHVNPVEEMVISTIYNMRGMEGYTLQPGYLGNAVISRSNTFNTQALQSDTRKTALALRAITESINKKDLDQDIEFIHKNIEAETIGNVFPEGIRKIFEGGILVNNYSKFPMYTVDFGSGTPRWVDFPRYYLARSATLTANPDSDGVKVHLTLPKKEMKQLLAMTEKERGFEKFVLS